MLKNILIRNYSLDFSNTDICKLTFDFVTLEITSKGRRRILPNVKLMTSRDLEKKSHDRRTRK